MDNLTLSPLMKLEREALFENNQKTTTWLSIEKLSLLGCNNFVQSAGKKIKKLQQL